MIGRDRINSDTGNKGWMICIEYASSLSMSHLQLLLQQLLLLAFSSLSASGYYRICDRVWYASRCVVLRLWAQA